ncbi:MAG TPA: DUF427 domain-containing protein [Gemmatimonadales bacterium]
MTRHGIRIIHRPTGLLLAEGPSGWGITRLGASYYVRRKYLRTGALAPNGVPGLCPYKGLYVWLDLRLPGRDPVPNLGWLYWLPNPLLPFVAFRVALDGSHPDLVVETIATTPERLTARAAPASNGTAAAADDGDRLPPAFQRGRH